MSAPIIHREFEQHSDDWYAIRAGKWTASHAATIMSGANTKGLADLVKTVAFERVYGVPDEPRYQSAAMQRGNELEQQAREWYEFATGSETETVGFVESQDQPTCGWSPDGLVGESGAVEIKCLLHKGWMQAKKSGKVPAEYRWQCKWAMWIGGLDSLDVVIYHPQAGGIIIPVRVDDGEIEAMRERVAMLDESVSEWTRILGGKS